MKIIGIGIDIVEVARIKNSVERTRSFINRIFEAREVRLSDRGTVRYEELAGRFAAKEAFLKAIKTGWRRGVAFKEIIILNEKSGAPYVVLEGRARKISAALGVKKIFASISHTRDLAIAMIVLTG